MHCFEQNLTRDSCLLSSATCRCWWMPRRCLRTQRNVHQQRGELPMWMHHRIQARHELPACLPRFVLNSPTHRMIVTSRDCCCFRVSRWWCSKVHVVSILLNFPLFRHWWVLQLDRLRPRISMPQHVGLLHLYVSSGLCGSWPGDRTLRVQQLHRYVCALCPRTSFSEWNTSWCC